MGWDEYSIATRERCGLCHRVSPIGFHVPDDFWQVAVPHPWRSTVLCIGCFVSFADERLLPWDRVITFYPVSLRTHLQDVRGVTIQEPPTVMGVDFGAAEPHSAVVIPARPRFPENRVIKEGREPS